MDTIKKFFKIDQRSSSVRREVQGGIVTFCAMSYIVVLNAQILSGKDSVAAVLDPDKLGLVSQTTALIAAGVITILMGIVANVPIAVAAALGLNSFVAACVSTVPGARWEFVMGLVTVEGLLILILALTGLRKLVFDIIPQSFRIAIGVGIGLFITLVGLWDSGFISKGSGTLLQQLGSIQENAQRALVVDSLGAIFGGFCSVSSNFTCIESSTTRRTGLVSVTIGFLFLVATFLAPLTTSVPVEVTSAALVFVGLLMISSVTKRLIGVTW